MSSVRAPAVAGLFYPGEAAALRDTVDRLLGEVPLPRRRSGSAAGADRAACRLCLFRPGRRRRLRPGRRRRCDLHPGRGDRPIALCRVPRHRRTARLGVRHAARRHPGRPRGDHGIPGVELADEPHRREHAIEVELPFLQRALGRDRSRSCRSSSATPRARKSRRRSQPFADDPKTLVVVSSDLSHFLPYEAAARRDQATAAAIERLEGDEVRAEDACGWLPIRGWLDAGAAAALRVERLDLRNSGDTAGDRRSVVGYGAWAFERAGTPMSAR